MIGSMNPLAEKYASLCAMKPAKSKVSVKAIAKHEKSIGKAVAS